MKYYAESRRNVNIPHKIRRRKSNLIFHIFCRNCLLKHVIEGKIEGMRRRGKRHKQVLDILKEKGR
jgi:hypothetical protein